MLEKAVASAATSALRFARPAKTFASVPMHVLITGGAGFIGRQISEQLLDAGHHVRVLDALLPQVHADVEPMLRPQVDLIEADVRDTVAIRHALSDVDHVIHLAAEVGVGQSMYAIERYVSANDLGTATLLQALVDHPVKRVVVASSMSIYGEGLYKTQSGEVRQDVIRGRPDTGRFDPADRDGGKLTPVPTPEWKAPNLCSVYALTKYVQERLCLTLCPHYGIEAVALRLFNVYGPGQALSNPYTGVLANFASRLLNGEAPLVFEDGHQRRDFIHVRDVARAFVLALEHPAAVGQTFNIGSGRDISIAEVAVELARAMGIDRSPTITGNVRAGDVRHCFADTSKARDHLGFVATMPFDQGLTELAGWLSGQTAHDRGQQARAELLERGLVQ
jgi:dTDP-L-rhamnose 4-epimerase